MDYSADNFESLRNKLKLRNLELKNSLVEKYPEVKKFLATGALTGALVFTPPNLQSGLPNPAEIVKNITDSKNDIEGSGVDFRTKLAPTLRQILPEDTQPLDRSSEKYLEVLFKNVMGIPTRATLEGEHLNSTYGVIGLEQHLARFPGDKVSYMAPGRGAWGYFAPSKTQMTQEDIEREKWYAVVQTLYLPDWNERLKYLRDWYKYRKVLIVNATNGNAVIADIADSGPAAWTGKQFGGSPEVMQALGGAKYTKGKVIMFFVDDPENTVPLGPVDYNNTSGLSLKS